MDILILARNILVPVAIGMWVIIGLVALIIFLKNKFSGSRRSLKSNRNEYKETFVQNHNAPENIFDDLNNSNCSENSDNSDSSNNSSRLKSSAGNKGGSSLCL